MPLLTNQFASPRPRRCVEDEKMMAAILGHRPRGFILDIRSEVSNVIGQYCGLIGQYCRSLVRWQGRGSTATPDGREWCSVCLA